MIHWTNAKDSKGNATRDFRIAREGARDVTGAVWLPAAPNRERTLVCFGHGASGDRYQAPIPQMAARFVNEAGLPVLAIDGPVHGLRQVGPGGRAAFFPEFRRETSLTEMTADWHLAIDAAQALDHIGSGNIAYFGLSMGSIFGIPLIASRTDVVVATLGLFGIQPSYPHEEAFLTATAAITCPLLYLMQLEDELFDRTGYLRAFDTFASKDKRIHANPGLHPMVPASEFDFAFHFMMAHIRGDTRQQASPVAE